MSSNIVASFCPVKDKSFAKSFLVPIDNPSQTALDYVIKKVAKPLDRIVLVHVRESPVDEMLAWEAAIIPEDHLEELETKMKDESKAILEVAMKKALALTNQLFIDCISIRGEARHELIALIEDLKPDLVCCNSRGMGILKSMIVGSVSLHLLHHSSVPVMILKDENL